MNANREPNIPPVGERHLGETEIRLLLERRLGPVHARQRLGIETERETFIFNGGRSFFHLENWYSVHSVIRNALRMTGLYGRGQRNMADIQRVDHEVDIAGLPANFAGLRILHVTDMHIDMAPETAQVLIDRVRGVEYDICVLTGDYRFQSHGGIESTLDGMAQLRANLTGPVYAVLGNHDSVRMLPELERMEFQVLMNEHVELNRDGQVIYLAGIDDAHFFGVGNIEKALTDIPENETTILLSHTPEVYRQAAHAGVDLFLCGHTHGGQICLPGGYPLTLDARLPRRMGRGRWQCQQMIGYTSVGSGASIVGVRLNCPPEITVHTLARAEPRPDAQ